jgi:hypothetical protein
MFRSCAFAVVVAFGLLVLAAAAAGAQVGPAVAQPAPAGQGCFSRQEQRMAVMQGRAIRLGVAMRMIHPRDGDELLRAELCRRSSGLVYVLTLLSRTGTVSRAIVDARNGAVIKDR